VQRTHWHLGLGLVRSARWSDIGRGLFWLAATGVVVTYVLNAVCPPLNARASFNQARIWAFLLRAPRVLSPVDEQEDSQERGVRRVRLEHSDAFAVTTVADLNDGSFAYIDGVQVSFQKYAPLDLEAARPMVFTRSPTGRSLFVACKAASECRQVVVITRRERLVWALRIVQMPARNGFIGLSLLALWAAVVFRLRRLDIATLVTVGRRLSILKRDPTPATEVVAGDRAPRPRFLLSGFSLDLLLAVGVGAIGAVVAAGEFANGLNLSYYQEAFEPAMNVALGRGFVPFSPAELSRNPRIADFLKNRVDSPGILDLDDSVSAAGLNQFQLLERYLMTSVGWTWRVVGMSHSALFFPWCLAVGLTVGAAFIFARTYVGRIAATLLAIFFLYSPTTLEMLQSPRDFLKAPFAFLFLAFAGRCAARSEERAGLWAIGAGLALGLGSGFRMDVLVLAPLFPVVLLLRHRMRRDVIGPALTFAVSLLISFWPIGSAFSGGSNAAHVSLLGQVRDFHGGGYPGAQEWNALEGYEDSHAIALSEVAAALRGIKPPAYSTGGYDRLVGSVLRDELRWAPADLVSRIIRTHQLLWELPLAPSNAPRDIPGWLRGLQSSWRHWAGWIWLLALATALLSRSGRYPVIFLAFLLAVASSWLQYAPRHVFHWLPVVLVVHLSALRWGASAVSGFFKDRQQRRLPAWKAMAIVVAFVAPAAVLAVARPWQTRIRRDLAQGLLNGGGVETPPLRATASTLKYPTALKPPSPGASAYSLLAVDWSRCPGHSLEIKWGMEGERGPALYRLIPGAPGQPGLSYVVHLRVFMRGQPTFFFVPLEGAPCVTVRELPLRPDFPILWSVVLAPGWENADHNLRLTDEFSGSGAVYSPATLTAAGPIDELRLYQRPAAGLLRESSVGTAGASFEFHRTSTPGSFWSPFFTAEQSGRYRFEFEIGGPGGEWRASVVSPAGQSRSNEVTVGEGSLAHPGTLLLRPLGLGRRVILDEWLESGEPNQLYLKSIDAAGSVPVSRFRVGSVSTREQP